VDPATVAIITQGLKPITGIVGNMMRPRQVIYTERIEVIPAEPAPRWPWIVAGAGVVMALAMEASR